ncbi:MAG: ECF transporter S component, partial [Candidatus Pararuminococcus gallinarum]
VSDTGPWGLFMNVLSTCAFVCPAAFIYKKSHTLKGAIIGIVVGSILMIIAMLLWNYLITPIYMKVPREAVVEMLVPAFLPFNALKAGLNGTLTILLYKPIVQALRKAKLIQPTQHPGGTPGKKKYGVILVAALVFITCTLLVLVFKGII